MSKQLLINCACGTEDAERATLPFIAANVAASADQETVVFLTCEGVRIATKGYAESVKKDGFPPLAEILASFVKNGGKIWACGTCTKPRGISEADLIEGAQIVTAAKMIEYVAGGATPLNLV
jgi:uncharacterized protein